MRGVQVLRARLGGCRHIAAGLQGALEHERAVALIQKVQVAAF